MSDIHVYMDKGQLWTTSLDVAEKFGRSHKNVLAAIQNLGCSEEFGRLNFKPSSYTNGQGKSQPLVVMNREGFSILVMGFTGKKAMVWKEKYIAAFKAMERHILKQGQLDWQQARAQGKITRRNETDTIQEFVDYATAQGSRNARFYYANLTAMTYKALFLVEKGLDQCGLREFMSALQLVNQAAAENIVARALRHGMDTGLPYKDCYSLAKNRVVSFADLTGREPLAQAAHHVQLSIQ